MLVIVAEDELECRQIDYDAACLSSDVDGGFEIQTLPGGETLDENGLPAVTRLLRSPGGVRQSLSQVLDEDCSTDA